MITKLTLSKIEHLNYTGISLLYIYNLLSRNYLVVESDTTGNENFYFKIEIRVGSSLIAIYDKLVPNSPSRLTFDLTEVLRLHMQDLAYVFQFNDHLAYSDFKIKVYEYYSGALQDSHDVDIYIRNTRAKSLADEKIYLLPDIRGISEKLIMPTSYYYYYEGNDPSNNNNLINNLITVNAPIYCSDVGVTKLKIQVLIDGNNYFDAIYSLDIFGVNELFQFNLSSIMTTSTTISDKLTVLVTLLDVANSPLYYDFIELKPKPNIERGEFSELLYKTQYGTYHSIILYETGKEYKAQIQAYNRKQDIYITDYLNGGQTKTHTYTSEQVKYFSDYLPYRTLDNLIFQLTHCKEAYIHDYYAGARTLKPVNILDVSKGAVVGDLNTLQNLKITLENSTYDNV